MTDIQDWYVVEYSVRQRCFHVEQVAEMLATNRQVFADMRAVDYIPLAFAQMRDEADELYRQFVAQVDPAA